MIYGGGCVLNGQVTESTKGTNFVDPHEYGDVRINNYTDKKRLVR